LGDYSSLYGNVTLICYTFRFINIQGLKCVISLHQRLIDDKVHQPSFLNIFYCIIIVGELIITGLYRLQLK